MLNIPTLKQLEKRIRVNPNDGDALWRLYWRFRLGSHGTNKNSDLAQKYLNQAAEAGYEPAIVELQRLVEEAKIGQQFAQQDKNDLERAKEQFEAQIGLAEAVQNKIIPALVIIRTRTGRVGVGFFQHTNWLVSNAHVLPSPSLLECTVLVDHQNSQHTLSSIQAYHRPPDKQIAPDVVVINTESRDSRNLLALALDFTGDNSYGPRYFFYYDLIDKQIKFLKPCSQAGYPITYSHENGDDPQPGTSGSPIFEARILLDRTPQWQFKVVAMLYARCSPKWHSQFDNTRPVSPQSQLVCAVPIAQEFRQILPILDDLSQAKRAGESAKVLQNIGTFKRETEQQRKSAEQREQLAQYHLERFESGETELSIELPEGLEKLWYSGIVKIECSLMIRKILKRELGKAAKKFPDVPDISLDELTADFNALIEVIKQNGEIKLVKGDTFFPSPGGYFRVDVGFGEKGQYWMLDIQDNTGTDLNGKPYKHENKSLSSVFAKVKIPKTKASIQGEDLAMLLLNSQRDEDVKYLSSEKDKKNEKRIPANSTPSRSLRNRQAYKAQQQTDFVEETPDLSEENHNQTHQQNISQHPKDEEVLIPADGDCFYASIFIGYLLPVISDLTQFETRLLKLINPDDINGKKDYGQFFKWLSIHYKDIDKLRSENFKKLILLFKKNMGIDITLWAGPEEIKILSQKLNIVIQEYTKDPNNNSDNVFLTPVENFAGLSLGTVYVLKTNAIPQEAVYKSADNNTQIAQLESTATSNQLQHYRLGLNPIRPLHPQNKNAVVHSESDSSHSTGNLFKSSKPGRSGSKEMKSIQKTAIKP